MTGRPSTVSALTNGSPGLWISDANPSVSNEIELNYLGGVAARVAPGETAFGDRSSPFVLNLLANWSDPADDAANIAWIRGLFARLRPTMAPGVHINFMSGDEADRVSEAYRERWERLRAIKTTYDPRNFFRLNQNIPPLTAATELSCSRARKRTGWKPRANNEASG